MAALLETIGGFVVILVGLLFGGIGLAIRQRNRVFRARAEAVRLRVVEVLREARKAVGSGSTQSVTYRPVYRVLDGPHAGREQRSSTGSAFWKGKEGREVDGWYDPADGSVVSAGDWKTGQVMVPILILVGAAGVTWGLWIVMEQWT